MRASLRTFALLLALLLALVAVPSVVMAAGGQSLPATVAAAFGAPTSFDPGGSAVSLPGGTVPRPTPRPIPPAPVPPRPAPVPTARPASTSTGITKIIGDRLSSTVYAFTRNGWLYRSDRDGRTWTLVMTNPPVENFLMSAADPNVLYSSSGVNCANAAVAIAPMYKSIDGGYTWTELPAGLALEPLLIDPANPDILFAADCSTLYLSTDGGVTWSPKPAADASSLWQTYAPVALASASLVEGSQSAAPHWEQIFGVGNDLQNTGVVVFSGDRGDTWANIASTTDTLIGVTDLEASLNESGKLWVVDNSGVWVSADYGVNWTLLNGGLSNLLRAGIVFNDVTYGQDGALYLATSAGLFVLRPGASTWERPSDVSFSDSTPMRNLLVTETNPRRLWINAENADGEPAVFSMVID